MTLWFPRKIMSGALIECEEATLFSVRLKFWLSIFSTWLWRCVDDCVVVNLTFSGFEEGDIGETSSLALTKIKVTSSVCSTRV